MKTNKEHRFDSNPKEKELHDKFIEMFKYDRNANTNLSAIVFGWENDSQTYPKKYLTEREEDVCLNLIQWFGSPVGQGFLYRCGFELKKEPTEKSQKQDISQKQD